MGTGIGVVAGADVVRTIRNNPILHGPVAKSLLAGIDSIKGTKLGLNSKDSIWLEVSPTEVRLKPNTNLKKAAVRKIAKNDFDRVWAIMQLSYNAYKNRNNRSLMVCGWDEVLDAPWDWFMHQTYKYSTPAHAAIKACKLVLRKYDPNAIYFMVAAPNKAGETHIHVLIKGISPIHRLCLLDELSWRHGRADMTRYEKSGEARSYIGKHFLKDEAEFDTNMGAEHA